MQPIEASLAIWRQQSTIDVSDEDIEAVRQAVLTLCRAYGNPANEIIAVLLAAVARNDGNACRVLADLVLAGSFSGHARASDAAETRALTPWALSDLHGSCLWLAVLFRDKPSLAPLIAKLGGVALRHEHGGDTDDGRRNAAEVLLWTTTLVNKSANLAQIADGLGLSPQTGILGYGYNGTFSGR